MTATSAAPIGRRFLSYRELVARGIRYSRVHIRRLEKAGYFPMHVVFGAGHETQALKAWVADEIEAWEAERINARDVKVKQQAGTGTEAYPALDLKRKPAAALTREQGRGGNVVPTLSGASEETESRPPNGTVPPPEMGGENCQSPPPEMGGTARPPKKGRATLSVPTAVATDAAPDGCRGGLTLDAGGRRSGEAAK